MSGALLVAGEGMAFNHSASSHLVAQRHGGHTVAGGTTPYALYRVVAIKGQDPRAVEVFNIALLDDDGLSNYDLSRLYLLTKRALMRGETEKEFHRAQSLDATQLYNAMLSPRAIAAIRRSLIDAYKKEFKQDVKLSTSDVLIELKELVSAEEF